jgi:Tol biopolymer transport system component
MRTIYFNVLFILLAILSFNACKKNDEQGNNQENIELGLYDFYLYDVNSNENTRITSGANQISVSYCISPDSKKIAYDNPNGINVMNIDGSENKTIVRGESPCFSIDGKKVIFTNDHKLYSINIDGSSKSLIVNSNIQLSNPILSRDGEKIACVSDSGLCIVSFDGQINSISSSYSYFRDWSSDSKELFYSKYTSDGYYQIYKYDITENKEYQLTSNKKSNESPRCNLLNNDIVFTSTDRDIRECDLILMNSKGINLDTILHMNNIYNPCWSPMGNMITFINENLDLAIVDKNGENYRIINEIPGACIKPIWTSDGKFILYYRAISTW